MRFTGIYPASTQSLPSLFSCLSPCYLLCRALLSSLSALCHLLSLSSPIPQTWVPRRLQGGRAAAPAPPHPQPPPTIETEAASAAPAPAAAPAGRGAAGGHRGAAGRAAWRGIGRAWGGPRGTFSWTWESGWIVWRRWGAL